MLKGMLFRFSSTLFISLASAGVGAQATHTGGGWEFSAFAGTEGFDSEAAYEQYIEDTGWSIGASADYVQGRWLSSFGLSLINYRDNAAFSQGTVDGNGNTEQSESNASAVLFTMGFGPLWRLGKNQDVTLFTQGGVGMIFSSSRGIPNCSDCYSEDIDINSGAFGRVGILKNTASAGAFGVSLAHYFSGDQTQTINFIWSTSY